MGFPIIVTTPVPVYRGDDTDFFSYTLTSSGTPVDLSAWTWTGQWRSKADDDVALDLVVDATDAATGVLHVAAIGAVTALMESKGVWDVQGVNGSQTLTYYRGTTVWAADVTRP